MCFGSLPQDTNCLTTLIFNNIAWVKLSVCRMFSINQSRFSLQKKIIISVFLFMKDWSVPFLCIRVLFSSSNRRLLNHTVCFEPAASMQ